MSQTLRFLPLKMKLCKKRKEQTFLGCFWEINFLSEKFTTTDESALEKFRCLPASGAKLFVFFKYEILVLHWCIHCMDRWNVRISVAYCNNINVHTFPEILLAPSTTPITTAFPLLKQKINRNDIITLWKECHWLTPNGDWLFINHQMQIK